MTRTYYFLCEFITQFFRLWHFVTTLLLQCQSWEVDIAVSIRHSTKNRKNQLQHSFPDSTSRQDVRAAAEARGMWASGEPPHMMGYRCSRSSWCVRRKGHTRVWNGAPEIWRFKFERGNWIQDGKLKVSRWYFWLQVSTGYSRLYSENEKSPDTSYDPVGLAEAAPNLFRTVSFSSSKNQLQHPLWDFKTTARCPRCCWSSQEMRRCVEPPPMMGTGVLCVRFHQPGVSENDTYSWQVWKRISENSKFKDGIEFKMEILTDQSGELSFKGKTRTRQTQTWPSCQCKNQLALRIVTGGYTSRAYVDAVQVAVSLFHWSYSKLARSIPRDFLRILFVSSHLV